MYLDGNSHCLFTHGMRGEVVLSVLGRGVGGMNTLTGVIPLPRVAMNGKITALSPVAVVPNGEPGEDRRLSISVICYLIPHPPSFFGSNAAFLPSCVKAWCSKDFQSCVKYPNIHKTFKLKFKSSKTNSPSQIISVVGNEPECLEASTK